jgi:peptidyl-tRNA hydrolase, PTH1 family
MQIWAGLGNPGAQYAMHRHNIGFMAVDVIAQDYGFAPWKMRFQAMTSEGRIGSTKILLIKPQTFMNESGRAIGEAMRFFKLDESAITVFYDELDLDPFRIKVKIGGGAAGHNGIRSTTAHIGPDFRRVRLGIGHPGHKDRVTGYVLGPFAKVETDDLTHMLGAVSAEAKWLAEGDDVRFMNDVAMRMQTE